MAKPVRSGRLALVVDDAESQRKVLSAMLKEQGYRVFTANDGARAVVMYSKYQPDLVLMDINMPVMDGYQAARNIKRASGDTLAPIIFITSDDTDQAFIDAVDAGGDGILVRPFSSAVFKAKIKSIERISRLYDQVKSLQMTQQKDAELAERLLSEVIEARNAGLERIGVIKKPAALFSGDIQLIAQCPNGDMNVLLGDFTGHGLRSSIGAIPLTETFRTMTKKGFEPLQIIAQINQQLHELLPTDLFLAMTFVSISSAERSIYVFNAGLPDAYLLSHKGETRQRFPSHHIPLGIAPKLFADARLSVAQVESDDHILLVSDGVLEARNEAGEMFGIERFEAAVKTGMQNGTLANTLLSKLEVFCQYMPQDDDMSLLDVPCGDWQQPHKNAEIEYERRELAPEYFLQSDDPQWTTAISLTCDKLAKVNPVPILMSQVQEIESDDEHWSSLYTVLTELYVNSLDHGVLELDSNMKSMAQGFADYFKEKQKRLDVLESGFINIKLAYFPLPNGGKVFVSIRDSGAGFNVKEIFTNNLRKDPFKPVLCGRGIELVSQLCDTLHYQENGSMVEATYVWQKD